MESIKRYACETRVVSGLGCISRLSEEIDFYHMKKPALIVDGGIAGAGLLEQWLPIRVASIQPRLTSPVDPSADQAQEAAEVARAAGCDGAVIIGGGSAMCLGKAVAILLTNTGDIADYDGVNKVKNLPVPAICIPTTAGSGSEVSRVTVLHQQGRDANITVASLGTEPRVALLDGNLMVAAPKKALTDAGLDAISHCCDSIWSHNRSLITDSLAESALETLITELPKALESREPLSLQRILEASTMANLACGNSGLALIHALTISPDVHLPHGYINGCLLLAVADFNAPFLNDRHKALVERLPQLFNHIGWQAAFKPEDLSREDIDLLVKGSSGHPFRANNIRPSTDEECYEILRAAGAPVRAKG